MRLPAIARPGLGAVGIASSLTLAAAGWSWWRGGLAWEAVAVLMGGIAVGLAAFFRDPDRHPPAGARHIVAPADGRVIAVDDVEERDFLGGRARRVAIFMSLWDVHVNRAPVAGTVTYVRREGGSFLPAFRREAAERNVRVSLGIDTGRERVLVRQVAGVLARRIVVQRGPGDTIARGERFGMICFGSRVDLFLPPSCRVQARLGDRTRAGETIVGELP